MDESQEMLTLVVGKHYRIDSLETGSFIGVYIQPDMKVFDAHIFRIEPHGSVYSVKVADMTFLGEVKQDWVDVGVPLKARGIKSE